MAVHLKSLTTVQASGFASDDLDEPEGDGAEVGAVDVDGQEKEKPSKKRKLTKAAEAKLKAQERKKAGKKGSGDDDDGDEDAYTALSKSLYTSGGSKPPIGSFENCAVCGKQFTVTKYTMAANSTPGFLCHQCAKAGGDNPFKKPAVPKKRKAPAEKRKVATFEERRFPTLVSICIQLVTKHINDIDVLGDIGSMNVEAISKALSKNRSLTTENVHLFYNPANASLTLFDVTNLPSPALETLAYHNANLTSLRLDFCGHLDDTAFKVFSTGLPLLQRIELLGPFLVRPAGWQEFFKAHTNLQGFLVTQSPRFDEACMKSLATHCSGIKELRLKEIGKLGDPFLLDIHRFKNGLWYLDLSEPSHSCSEKAVIALLRAVGRDLTHLNLSKHDELTNHFLDEGLRPHVSKLESLTISHLPELTDAGVGEFFINWTNNPPLLSLDMSRNSELGTQALAAALKHSGKRLENLNINGWKDTDDDSLKMIGLVAFELKRLDVGWCRMVDDFLVQCWLEGELKRGSRTGGCRNLEEIKVWGCNKVSHTCPRKVRYYYSPSPSSTASLKNHNIARRAYPSSVLNRRLRDNIIIGRYSWRIIYLSWSSVLNIPDLDVE
ncbi:hypothetical protein M413DRAFT_408092 [Hebeloma cylindrosporum]|uniref:DNA repair protein rhp7 treble clef domain-containing protein n=1 Tax=Hebeloma cylindrosporum TaxID=76867 RepID=A0A0C3D0Y6_HEBCY|nr:hypothetical protein M413DRAFT_408092 [Hebeloma cylindrosporum h7]